ncbi:MAG: hypothetical protein V3U02_12825 [Calditrichia bacterium]
MIDIKTAVVWAISLEQSSLKQKIMFLPQLTEELQKDAIELDFLLN